MGTSSTRIRPNRSDGRGPGRPRGFQLVAGAPLLATSAAAQTDRWVAEGWRTDFTRLAVDIAEIRSVIPRDGIPAIDNPQFVPVTAGLDLADREPVIGLVINGDAKAYPFGS